MTLPLSDPLHQRQNLPWRGQAPLKNLVAIPLVGKATARPTRTRRAEFWTATRAFWYWFPKYGWVFPIHRCLHKSPPPHVPVRAAFVPPPPPRITLSLPSLRPPPVRLL